MREAQLPGWWLGIGLFVLLVVLWLALRVREGLRQLHRNEARAVEAALRERERAVASAASAAPTLACPPTPPLMAGPVQGVRVGGPHVATGVPVSPGMTTTSPPTERNLVAGIGHHDWVHVLTLLRDEQIARGLTHADATAIAAAAAAASAARVAVAGIAADTADAASASTTTRPGLSAQPSVGARAEGTATLPPTAPSVLATVQTLRARMNAAAHTRCFDTAHRLLDELWGLDPSAVDPRRGGGARRCSRGPSERRRQVVSTRRGRRQRRS
jgi:hypothetical protein